MTFLNYQSPKGSVLCKNPSVATYVLQSMRQRITEGLFDVVRINNCGQRHNRLLHANTSALDNTSRQDEPEAQMKRFRVKLVVTLTRASEDFASLFPSRLKLEVWQFKPMSSWIRAQKHHLSTRTYFLGYAFKKAHGQLTLSQYHSTQNLLKSIL